MAKHNWFRMEKKGAELAEVAIFDEIGFWGINAKDFKAEFDQIKDAASIKVSINSPGGNVFDGMAIYNMLAAVRDKVEVEVLGLAASIASVIALAGKKLIMAEGSYYMVHDPWTIAMGNAEEMKKTAEVLDKMRGSFGEIYARKTGKDLDEVLDLMREETWLTAEEAAAEGFADETVDYGEIAAKLPDISKYSFHHAPEVLAHEGGHRRIETERQFERYLRDGGMSRTEAQVLTKAFRALHRGEPEPQPPQGEPAAEGPKPEPFRIDALLEQEVEVDNEIMEVIHAYS